MCIFLSQTSAFELGAILEKMDKIVFEVHLKLVTFIAGLMWTGLEYFLQYVAQNFRKVSF